MRTKTLTIDQRLLGELVAETKALRGSVDTLTGDLRVSALEQSLSEILRRHEILRTTFVTENDQPVQMIAPPGTFTLPLIDLGVLPEEQREAKVRRSRIFGNKKLCL